MSKILLIPIHGRDGREEFISIDSEMAIFTCGFKWFISPAGFVLGYRNDFKLISLHRLILKKNNFPFKEVYCYHKDRNKLNNCLSNLVPRGNGVFLTKFRKMRFEDKRRSLRLLAKN